MEERVEGKAVSLAIQHRERETEGGQYNNQDKARVRYSMKMDNNGDYDDYRKASGLGK